MGVQLIICVANKYTYMHAYLYPIWREYILEKECIFEKDKQNRRAERRARKMEKNQKNALNIFFCIKTNPKKNITKQGSSEFQRDYLCSSTTHLHLPTFIIYKTLTFLNIFIRSYTRLPHIYCHLQRHPYTGLSSHSHSHDYVSFIIFAFTLPLTI